MNERVKGIVLSEIDIKENDKIIQVITAEYGKISFYGRGLKKINSKNAYACQLFDLSEFSFDYRETKMQLLKSATLINEFYNIKQDYEKLMLASIILEIANNMEEDSLYELLLQTLQLLENTTEAYTVFDLFVVRILLMFGINPEVDSCVSCGETTNIETISINDGGFLCHNCNSQSHYQKYDAEFLKKFRIINKANFDVLDKILNLGLNTYDLSKPLLDFFIAHSGINLRSYRNLQNFHEST